MSHINAITRLEYQGHNPVMLALDASRKGYKASEWATFLQWRNAGYKVNKGEKASYIRTFVEVTKVEKKDGKRVAVAGRAPRGYAVFNIEQVKKI